jgi:hypothetical protein
MAIWLRWTWWFTALLACPIGMVVSLAITMHAQPGFYFAIVLFVLFMLQWFVSVGASIAVCWITMNNEVRWLAWVFVLFVLAVTCWYGLIRGFAIVWMKYV